MSQGCSQKKGSPDRYGVANSLIGKERVVFSYHDSKYDDRGTGKYIYPLNLRQRDGLFDLTHFQVRQVGKLLEFSVHFRAPVTQEEIGILPPIEQNSAEAISLDPNLGRAIVQDWLFQMVDIYIDTDRKPGSGNTFSLPGRNIEFNPDEGWEKVVVLSPGPEKEIRGYLSAQSEKSWLYRARNDVLIPQDIIVRQYHLIARVSFHEFENPDPSSWGYQVCVMGYNPANLTLNGMLNAEALMHATDTDFGGGTNQVGNPNVIDVLSPNKEAQYSVLSAYRSGPFKGDHVLALLPMIYLKAKGTDLR